MAARAESGSHSSGRASGPLSLFSARRARGGSVADPAEHHEEDHDHLYEIRLKKLEAIEQAGIDPFPARYPRTHTLAESKSRFPELDGFEVRVAGRIMGSLRRMGKASFAHLQDESGRLQLYFKRDVMTPECYDFWLDHLDVADHI